MNSILKWSQNIRISLVVWVISLALVLVNFFLLHAPFISIIIFIMSALIYWGLSVAFKLKNSTISSALFMGGISSIGSLLTIFGITLPSFWYFFWIVAGLLIIFIVFKNVYQTSWGTAIWLVILNGLVSGLLITGYAYFYILH